jgi:hypothetical protein
MTNDFVVVIPTYQRSTIIASHTLHFLERANIPHNRIHLFIANTQSEINAYQIYQTRGYNLHYGPVGLHHMRNFIHKSFPENTHMLCMDDDISTIVQMREDVSITNPKSSKRYPLYDDMYLHFQSWISNAFEMLQHHNATLFGIYPVKNGYFMKSLPECTYDLRFCVGTLWGMRNRHDIVLNIEEKEDMERTLICWDKDKVILRFNHITPVTKYYVTPGGMQAHNKNRKEEAKSSCQYLLAKYPQWCKLWTSKKSGVYEVRLTPCGTLSSDSRN